MKNAAPYNKENTVDYEFKFSISQWKVHVVLRTVSRPFHSLKMRISNDVIVCQWISTNTQ